MSAYALINEDIESVPDGTRAASLHGYCIGALCVAASDLWAGFAEEYLPGESITPGARFVESLQTLLQESAAALESGEFDLELLLPGDEATMELRLAALAAWAEAFLRGLAQTRVDLALPALAEEALEDVQAISELDETSGVDDDVDEETAFAGLVEHLRLAVSQVYVDLASARGAAAAGDDDDEV